MKISRLNTIEILRSLVLFLCINNPISRNFWNVDIFPCSDEFWIQFCLKYFIYHVYYRQKLTENHLSLICLSMLPWYSFHKYSVYYNNVPSLVKSLGQNYNIIMSWVFISSSIACLLSDLKVLFVIVGYIMFVNSDILSQLLLINFLDRYKE